MPELKRFFTTRHRHHPSPYPSPISSHSPTAFSSPHHEQVLKECIQLLRHDIFNLQQRINACHANLTTISRCIEVRLTTFTAFPLPPMSDDGQITKQPKHPRRQLSHTLTPSELFLGLNALARRNVHTPITAQPPPSRSSTTSSSSSRPNTRLQKNDLTNPLFLIERPQKIRPEEMDIPLPTSLSPEYIREMSGKGDLEFKLELLVCKKAELEIEHDLLSGELCFWGSIWNDMNRSFHQNRPSLNTPQNSIAPHNSNPPKPTTTTSKSKSHVPPPIKSTHPTTLTTVTSNRANQYPCPTPLSLPPSQTIQRKDVPVLGMLERLGLGLGEGITSSPEMMAESRDTSSSRIKVEGEVSGEGCKKCSSMKGFFELGTGGEGGKDGKGLDKGKEKEKWEVEKGVTVQAIKRGNSGKDRHVSHDSGVDVSLDYEEKLKDVGGSIGDRPLVGSWVD